MGPKLEGCTFANFGNSSGARRNRISGIWTLRGLRRTLVCSTLNNYFFAMIDFQSKSNTLFYCLFLVNWRKYFMLWIAIRHLWCCTFFSALLIGIFSLSPSSFLPSSYLDTRCRWNAFNNHDVSGMGPHKEPIRVEFFFYFCRWDDTQWQHKVRQFFFFCR